MTRTAPLQEFIVKIASRCNLNCDYCYEYNLGDNTWRSQPHFMDLGTIRTLASRIRQHAQKHGLAEVILTFHGGEPLLVGPDRLDQYCAAVRNALDGTCTVHFGVQTNATLLTQDVLDVVRRYEIAVSVSLDGPERANDLHRMDHQGRSSFRATLDGIERLRTLAPDRFTGLLAVVDVRNDPVEMFDFLAGFGCSLIDFLLPHHHWERPPFRPMGDAVAYGRWYWRLYLAWVADRHPTIDIRYFKNIVSQIAGGNAWLEAMTLEPCRLVTIATDGAIEAVDCLKSTASGAQVSGLNVAGSGFDEALELPVISMRQAGADQLCNQCRSCAHLRSCAGGYYPHRFSLSRGFDNPSVYCDDLFWLLNNIREHLKGTRRR